MLAANLRHSQPGLLLFDHPNNLRLGKTALSHSSAPSRLGRLYIMMRDFAGGRSKRLIKVVRLVQECGVAVVQTSRNLEISESLLRRWISETNSAPVSALPGNGQQRAELAKIATLKKEVDKLKAEHDILKRR